VRSYKQLEAVERAFRSLKTFDLAVRPIRHYTQPRVKAHVFLCMLAYYVTWHMKDALKPMLFAGEELGPLRDPVAPPPRSLSARKKDSTKQTAEGEPVHSFRTLLSNLSTIVRNICRRKGDPTSPPTIIVSTPTPLQKKAYELIAKIRPEREESSSGKCTQ
jgi:transposase